MFSNIFKTLTNMSLATDDFTVTDDLIVGDNIELTSTGGKIFWSASSDISITHQNNVGVELEVTGTAAALHSDIFQLKTNTSNATPEVGIGSSLLWNVECQSNDFKEGIRLKGLTTDVTNDQEDFDMVLELMEYGATAVEKYRFRHDANLVITGKEASPSSLTLTKDDGDDAADVWKMTHLVSSDVLAFQNDAGSKGTPVSMLTITPNATVADSTVRCLGNLIVTTDATVSGQVIVNEASQDAKGLKIVANDGSSTTNTYRGASRVDLGSGYTQARAVLSAGDASGLFLVTEEGSGKYTLFHARCASGSNNADVTVISNDTLSASNGGTARTLAVSSCTDGAVVHIHTLSATIGYIDSFVQYAA